VSVEPAPASTKKTGTAVEPKPGSKPVPDASVAHEKPVFAKPVPGKPGFVTNPYDEAKGFIDVRGFPPGTEVKDPSTGRNFLVP